MTQMTNIMNKRGDIIINAIEKMNYKRILWTAICQQIMWPQWNRQTLRKIAAETDSRRNRKSEQTYDKWLS